MTLGSFFKLSLLLALGAILIHEFVQVVHCTHECHHERVTNGNLALSDACRSKDYGEPMRLLCQKASADLSVSDAVCVIHKYWRRHEVMRLYNMYAESHWMLFGLGAVAIVSLVHYFYKWLVLSLPAPVEGREEKKQKKNTHNDLIQANLVMMLEYQQQQQELLRNSIGRQLQQRGEGLRPVWNNPLEQEEEKPLIL